MQLRLFIWSVEQANRTAIGASGDLEGEISLSELERHHPVIHFAKDHNIPKLLDSILWIIWRIINLCETHGD